MHKGGNGWQASRAVACLPALTGNLGVAGGGFGPRHGSAAQRMGEAWACRHCQVLSHPRSTPVLPDEAVDAFGFSASPYFRWVKKTTTRLSEPKIAMNAAIPMP